MNRLVNHYDKLLSPIKANKLNVQEKSCTIKKLKDMMKVMEFSDGGDIMVKPLEKYDTDTEQALHLPSSVRHNFK